MTHNDVIDSAIAEAMAGATPAAPDDMRERVANHLAHRARRRRIATVGTSMVAALVVAGTVFAIGAPHGDRVETGHPGGSATTVASAPTTTTGVPRVHKAADPPAHKNPAPNGRIGTVAAGAQGSATGTGAGAGAGTAAPHGGTPSHPGNGTGPTPPAGGGGTPTTTPPTPTTPPDPSPTSHLIVDLRDDGMLHPSATRVLTNATVTFHDDRTVKNPSVNLQASFGGGAVDRDSFTATDAVGPASIFIGIGTSATPMTSIAPAAIEIVAPQLAPPTEPNDVLTVDVHIGDWTLPYRTVGDYAPYVKGQIGRMGARWTDIDVGTYTLVIRNPDHLTRTFTVPGLAGRQHISPSQSQISLTMIITSDPSRTFAIDPVSERDRTAGEGMVFWIQ